MERKKILLVDDSRTILMMEQMILKKSPYTMVTAGNGEEALAKAEAERPDLILLDVMMPKMDGFETCRRLRSSAATASIPIVMVTTRGEETNVETAYQAGCTDYGTKPIDSIELLSKLRNYLGE